MSGGFINLRVVGQDGKPHAEGRLYQPKTAETPKAEEPKAEFKSWLDWADERFAGQEPEAPQNDVRKKLSRMEERRLRKQTKDRVRKFSSDMMFAGNRRRIAQGMMNEARNVDWDDPEQVRNFEQRTGSRLGDDGNIYGEDMPSDDFLKQYWRKR